MKSTRAIASAAIAVALIGAGCNSRLLRPPVTVYADAGGHGISVTVADVERRYDSVLLSFLPSRVPLHPGDAVNFQVQDTGEPHTVAMGKLVDAAVTTLATVDPIADAKTVEALPQMRKLPSVFPNVIEDGRPRANGSAVQRCFLPTGAPSVSATGGAPACAEREQPEFDGTQSFYSSGYLEEGEPFRVKLAPDIRPGTYAFMCLVHRASMTGAIEVRPPEVERPRVADMRKQGSDEEDEVASTLEQAARRAVELKTGVVLAGTGPVGRVRGFISSFIPNDLEIDRGETVEWQLFGTHSISFDPSRDAQEGLLVEDADGALINLDAWRPVGSRTPPAAAVSFPPTASKVDVDGGTWSGEGSFSSGILRATPPTAITYKLTFANPGTYRYRCLVHSRMRGRVVVSD